ncbi:MAG: hypothetical protein ACI9OH_001575 [Oleispira sp.]|jgi:hypothetical protein
MNFIKNLAVLFVFIMAIISCTLPAADDLRSAEHQGVFELETLYGLTLAKESIIITVVSTGCTQEEDFHLQTSATPEGYDVSIMRTKPDRCRRAPMFEQIRIPLDHSRKNDHFRILNSVKMKP